MKYIVFILPLLIVIACAIEQADAQVTITDWSQVFDVNSNSYSAVEVHYRITNTGEVTISSYTIYAEATCADGSTYEKSTFGFDLPAGESIEAFFYIDTDGKQATEVEITDWQVKQ